MLIKVGIFLPMIIALYNDAKMMKISDEDRKGFLSFHHVRGAAFPRSVAQLWSPWTVIPSDLDHCKLTQWGVRSDGIASACRGFFSAQDP